MHRSDVVQLGTSTVLSNPMQSENELWEPLAQQEREKSHPIACETASSGSAWTPVTIAQQFEHLPEHAHKQHTAKTTISDNVRHTDSVCSVLQNIQIRDFEKKPSKVGWWLSAAYHSLWRVALPLWRKAVFTSALSSDTQSATGHLKQHNCDKAAIFGSENSQILCPILQKAKNFTHSKILHIGHV